MDEIEALAAMRDAAESAGYSPDPMCVGCYGTGYDDADHDGERFVMTRCGCSL